MLGSLGCKVQRHIAAHAVARHDSAPAFAAASTCARFVNPQLLTCPTLKIPILSYPFEQREDRVFYAVCNKPAPPEGFPDAIMHRYTYELPEEYLSHGPHGVTMRLPEFYFEKGFDG